MDYIVENKAFVIQSYLVLTTIVPGEKEDGTAATTSRVNVSWCE